MAKGGEVHHFNKQTTTQNKKRRTTTNNRNNTREGEVSTRKRHGMMKEQCKARNNKSQRIATMQGEGNAPQ